MKPHEKAKVSISELQPVPITEDRLFKIGVVRNLELEGRGLKEYSLGNRLTANFIRICYHKIGKYTMSYRDCPLIKPKYMHQIQNFYFDLTEEELTI